MWFLLHAYSIYVVTTAFSTCMLNFIEASLKCSFNLFLYDLEFISPQMLNWSGKRYLIRAN